MKSMMLAAAGLFGAVFCASAAKADCPSTGLQDAVNIYSGVGTATGPVVDGLAQENASLIKACGSKPHVLKIAALTYQGLTGRTQDPAKQYEYAVAARKTYVAMRDARAPNESEQFVMINNQPLYIGVYGNDPAEAQILENVFIMESRTNKLTPDHMPVDAAASAKACPAWSKTDAFNAASFIRKNAKTDIPSARNYIDRLIAACGKASPSDRVQLLAARAKVNYDLLKASPQRANANPMLDQLIADSRTIFELKPGGDSIFWSTYDRDRLTALIEEVRPTPLTPEADWFKPGNPEKPETVKAIAKKLDAAWAIDEPLGIGAKFQNYRALITDLYAKATASGNVAPARKALALAAKGHADGSLRAASNKGLKSPPDFLWKWIDPSVTPTATAVGAK